MAKSKQSKATGHDSILLGSACVTINPPRGVPLVGYPTPRPNEGVGLDLCARALVFADDPGGCRAGDSGAGSAGRSGRACRVGKPAPRAAIVVLDNIGVDAGVVARIRRKAAARVKGLAPETILVAATHTHSAPLLKSWKRAGKVVVAADKKYVRQLVEGASAAIAAAAKDLSAVRMRVGRTEAFLGHNRRVLDAEGKAHAEWLDPDGRHTGYFNPQLPFVVFEGAGTGKPVAMVVSYWCHPVTLGPPSKLASPDYPGYLVRRLQKATGAKTVLHLTGGGANINPRKALHGNPAHTKRMGHELAAKVLAALSWARPVPAGPVRSASAPLKLRLSAKAIENDSGRGEDSPDGKTLTTEVQALALGDLVFVTAPGELFAEIGAAMQAASPFAHTVVVGYADDYLGYLFTDRARKEGGYEPSNPISQSIERPLIAAAKKAMRQALGNRD